MLYINSIESIRKRFVELYKAEQFVTDKTGVKTLEIVGAQFLANEESIFGLLDPDYIEREIIWYLSQDLNVNALGKVPKEWLKAADKYGFVNSNYGWCIFHHHNYSQYEHVLKELYKNPDSRRAVMIYNRPRMWEDYKWQGRNDFMCTNDVQYVIRDGRLSCVVNMRSNDVIYGYKNDRAWQLFVLNKLKMDLEVRGVKIEIGDMIWNAGSLHIYERHFDFVR